MWELDYKESWAPKNWCFWTVLLEKTLESPLDCKEIQPVHPKGDQSWVFIVGTDVEAETLILWPPDVKSWLIWKDPHAGKDWGQEEKGMTEDETVGWHHWLNEHGFGCTPEVGDGHGLFMRQAAVYGVTKSWTQLSDWTELSESKTVGSLSENSSTFLWSWTSFTIWSSNSIPRYISKKYENMSTQIFTEIIIRASFRTVTRWKQPKCSWRE